MNTTLLQSEAAHYQLLQDQLKQSYADIDDETLSAPSISGKSRSST